MSKTGNQRLTMLKYNNKFNVFLVPVLSIQLLLLWRDRLRASIKANRSGEHEFTLTEKGKNILDKIFDDIEIIQ